MPKSKPTLESIEPEVNKPTPKLEVVEPKAVESNPEAVEPIKKPTAFSLDKFKSKRASAIANVETLQTGLPHGKISAAKDFVRLHPNQDLYWSDELCFVNVPIKGQRRDTLHLIGEELAMQYLPSGKILRFRLALATKPYDVFFLAEIPTRNEDNPWNASNIAACEQAKATWVQVTSRKEEGAEAYKIDLARDADAFPQPKWPTQSLDGLIGVSFNGRMIEGENHPALLRLIGAKQNSVVIEYEISGDEFKPHRRGFPKPEQSSSCHE